MRLNTLLSAALLTLVAALPLSANSTSNLAQNIIDLRADVEALHQEIDDLKEQYAQRMKSLSAQRTEQEGNIARETLKKEQLKSSLVKTQERIKHKSGSSKALEPLALEGIALLREVISAQLPFKLPERLSELDALAKSIQDHQMTPQKALNRAWAIYEDNFRLSHENGIFRQNVTLGKQEYLADVVRLGSVMMYFKTSDDKVGYFAKTSSGYTPQEIVDGQMKKHVYALFDSMKKQIRSGYFALPYAVSVSE